MYGHKWSSIYGEEFDPSLAICVQWAHALENFTSHQFGNGMRACLTEHPAWPPTLGEFILACVPPEEQIRESTHDRSWKPDPRKMPSQERVAWHRANIAWLQAGNELPRPGVVEPPGPR